MKPSLEKRWQLYKAEKVLGIKLSPCQKNYILYDYALPTARRCGRTFAQCLKLCLSEGKTVDARAGSYVCEFVTYEHIGQKCIPHLWYGKYDSAFDYIDKVERRDINRYMFTERMLYAIHNRLATSHLVEVRSILFDLRDVSRHDYGRIEKTVLKNKYLPWGMKDRKDIKRTIEEALKHKVLKLRSPSNIVIDRSWSEIIWLIIEYIKRRKEHK